MTITLSKNMRMEPATRKTIESIEYRGDFLDVGGQAEEKQNLRQN